ncbi:hypothetical protein Scep_002763 [Stephania cephalantha]|uniref:Uncharacterized protein n=1 Tax=Stephania cephalantha TaxID=152367 RepID=A0AAP0Q4L8_9MAGN
MCGSHSSQPKSYKLVNLTPKSKLYLFNLSRSVEEKRKKNLTEERKKKPKRGRRKEERERERGRERETELEGGDQGPSSKHRSGKEKFGDFLERFGDSPHSFVCLDFCCIIIVMSFWVVH